MKYKKKVLVSCPHCYHVFNNGYAQLGVQLDAIHHTELISDLIKSNKLPVKSKIHQTVTCHDSCYLGRYNRIFDIPRTIINSLSEKQLVELKAAE